MTARKQTSIKVDPVAWEEAKKIFKEYGITASDAINIFLNEVRLKGGLPFAMRLPSDRLKKAIEEANKGEVKRFDTIDELIEDLK
jgi:DNA-damage-inducible protein J